MDGFEHIEGNVIEIVYSNPENGYTVCEIDSDTSGIFTATGYMPYLSEGERIAMTGVWVTHPEYGEQFKAEFYESVLPTEDDAVVRYLSSGIVPGIREATAIKLVEHFGGAVLNIMLTDPIRLSEIKGISKKRAEKIGEDFLELQSVQGIVMFLQQYKVSPNMAVKVHQVLGTNAVERIKSNPYILSDLVEGISFKTADNIAYLMNIPKNNPERIRSGLKYFLSQAAYSSGHTYLPEEVLTEHGAYHLSISTDEAENGLNSLVLEKNVYFDTIDGKRVCYLASLAKAENYVTLRLASLAGNKPELGMTEAELEDKISQLAEEEGITLAPEQALAVETAAKSGCMIITGGPGTGKTTTINTIIRLLKEMSLSIALTAPTGRAAKRMGEVCGMEAMTIHRMLGVQNAEGRLIFSHNEDNPLTADVIIVDEMSMIDITLMEAFLRAVKRGARVIMSGDADQLPSVGPGNVLRDIIASGVVPTIRLARIFRQAQESLIVVNAHRINKGEMPDLGRVDSDFFFMNRISSELVVQTIAELYRHRLPNSYGLNPLTDIQILSPSKKGISGVASINSVIQAQVNPPDMMKQEVSYGKNIFRVGDKVMQTKNNYDIGWIRDNGEEGTGVFNGDMGIIASISSTDKYMNVVFDDDKLVRVDFNSLDALELAYAVTVHKSQGSEFPVVIVPMCNFAPMLMCRNLLYTAVTRAKKLVILVGTREAAVKMVMNNKEGVRYTGLEEKLRNIIRDDNIGFKK